MIVIAIGQTCQYDMMNVRVLRWTDRTCSQVDGKGSQLNQMIGDPAAGHEIGFILR